MQVYTACYLAPFISLITCYIASVPLNLHTIPSSLLQFQKHGTILLPEAMSLNMSGINIKGKGELHNSQLPTPEWKMDSKYVNTNISSYKLNCKSERALFCIQIRTGLFIK